MATPETVTKDDIDDIDERLWTAGVVGISQDYVDYLRKKNNERAAKERERIRKETAQSE